jgi:hypothetical protein
MFVEAVEIGFFGGVSQVAALDLFAYVAIDQALKSDGLAQWQAMVDFQPQSLGRTSGFRLGRIIVECSQSYRWPGC